MNSSLLKVLNVVGFIGMVAANAAASIVPINNLTTGEISDMYPNLFTPAGYVFSIWGLIYLLLLAFVIYQARDVFSAQKQDMPFVGTIGPWFFVSCLLNAGWIFAWHYLQIGLSLAIMLALLATLTVIYLRLDADRGVSPRWWVQLPFRIYLGWITIATIANVTALLVDSGWQGFGLSPVTWTIIMIGAAVAITSAFLWLKGDWAVAAVAVWAVAGIAVERYAEVSMTTPVFWAALVACALVVIQAMAVLITRPGRAV